MLNNIKNNDFKAGVYMLASITIGALMPLIIQLSNAKISPFFTGGIYNLSSAIICFLFLLIYQFNMSKNISHLKLCVLESVKFKTLKFFIPSIIGVSFASSFFTWSINYIDPATAAIIFATWPIIMVANTGILFKNKNKFNKTNCEIYFFMFLALIGFAFVSLSESVEIPLSRNENFIKGAFLALLGGIASSLVATFTLRSGKSIEENLQTESKVLTFMFCVIFSLFISRLIGAIVPFYISYSSDEKITFDLFLWCSVCGILVGGVSSILFRKANVLTKNLGINSLVYFRIIISLFLLWLFDQTNAFDQKYFIIGVIIIITANFLINFSNYIDNFYKAVITILLVIWAWSYFEQYNFFNNGYILIVIISSSIYLTSKIPQIEKFNKNGDSENNITKGK